MENRFALMITKLRNQRGLSQKAAAEKLGISQGLLSHYEKGIRECGLDFVIKAAEFYSVSCGYLLGVEGDTDEKKVEEGKLSKKASRVINSVFSINEMSTQLGGENLCNKTNDLMAVYAYNILRVLDSKNTTGAFDIESGQSFMRSSAYIHNTLAKISNTSSKSGEIFELRKETEKLIKNVEQKLDIL